MDRRLSGNRHEHQRGLASARQRPAFWGHDASQGRVPTQRRNPRDLSATSVPDPSLPSSNTAVVLSWFDPSIDNFPDIIKMLTARGYQVAPGNTVDPPTLRALPSQPIGVLYMFTHGLFGIEPGQTMPSQDPEDPGAVSTPVLFGLATSTPTNVTQAQLSPADWAALQADIHATPPRLVPGSFPNASRNPNGMVVDTTQRGVFFATLDFFGHYWGPNTFSQGSVVFVNGCNSAQDDFQGICVNAGAGLVLGWTMDTKLADAAATANFIFDRMLGANNQGPLCFPELVAQRPFDWDTVAMDLKNHQSALFHDLGTSIVNFNGTATDVTLSPLNNGSSGLLVPSIVCVGVNEITKQLYINGSFGSEMGTVSILTGLDSSSTGSEPSIQTWTPQMITCTMAAGAAGAGQAFGYVVVSVGPRQSNCIPLTAWSGQITAKAVGNGSLLDTVIFDCHLRVDAHLYRTDFSTKLNSDSYISVPRTAMPSQDSTCNYKGDGTYTETDPAGTVITQSLSGSGSLQPVSAAAQGAAGPPSAFDVMLKADLTVDASINETHNVTLLLFMPGNPGSTPTYAIQLTTQSGDQGPTTSDIDAIEFCGAFGEVTVLNNASSYDIPDPNIQVPALGGILPNAVLNLTLDCAYPPTPAKGEDYIPIMG
jgi:hypothetical protein